MPIKQQVQNYFNFTAGLNTESNPLTAPENTCLDMENVDLLIDGSIRKRYGLLPIDQVQTSIVNVGGANVVSGFPHAVLWKDAKGTGEDLIVVIEGTSLLFFDANTLTPVIARTTAIVNGPTAAVAISSTTFGLGIMFVAYEHIATPNAYIYDGVLNQVTAKPLHVLIRDMEGDPADTFLDSDRTVTAGVAAPPLFPFGTALISPVTTIPPVVLTPAQQVAQKARIYNLNNEGWYRFPTVRDSSPHPSRADKSPIRETPIAQVLPAIQDGNSPSPRGHFIYDLYDIDRTINNGVTRDNTIAVLTAVEFYANRLWYAGMYNVETNFQTLNNGNQIIPATTGSQLSTLYFSRVVLSKQSLSDLNSKGWEDIARCHQLNDPSSSENWELLPDDGGQVTITGAGKIHDMVEFDNSLLVFASRGVWVIKGTANGGVFTATDYTITKLTNIELISNSAVAVLTESVVFLSTSGLYLIDKEGSVTSITDMTINRLIVGLPLETLQNATLMYDPTEKELRMLYGEQLPTGVLTTISSRHHYYTHELVLDTRKKAWYKNSYLAMTEAALAAQNAASIDKSRPLRIIGAVPSIGTGEVTTMYVCSQTRNNPAVGAIPASTTIETFLVAKTNKLFYDLLVAAKYPAFLETNAQIYADGMRNKQLQWFETFMQETENSLGIPSSATCQVKWEWATDPASGKLSDPFPIYKLDKYLKANGAGSLVNVTSQVIATRHKVNGTGKSLSLRFEAVPGNAMHLLGWSVVITGNSTV